MNIYRRKKKDGKLASPFHYYRFTFEGREYSGSTKTTDAKLARQIMTKRHTLAFTRLASGCLGGTPRSPQGGGDLACGAGGRVLFLWRGSAAGIADAMRGQRSTSSPLPRPVFDP